MKIALTEDISIRNELTQAGSKILQGYRPPFNATIVDKLEEKGIAIGTRIKISEFALLEGDNTAIGTIDEPKLWPSYGLVSRYGIISSTSSLSPISIMAKSLDDISFLLDAVKGYDPKDSASIDCELEEEASFSRLLVPHVLSGLIGFGAEVELEYDKYIVPSYKILASAEFASLAAKYDGIRYGYRAENFNDREELYRNTRSQAFGKEAKKTILFGNYVLSPGQYDSFYKQAQRIRTLIKAEIDNILEDNNALILPIAEARDKKYTKLCAMTGYPMISIPYGDIDLHILAKPLKERSLIKLAKELGGNLHG